MNLVKKRKIIFRSGKQRLFVGSNVYINEYIHVDRWADGWIDGWMNGSIDGWMGRERDFQTYIKYIVQQLEV